jgi:hypothetical protein
MSTQKIQIECVDCGGTGLYCGMCEPEGTAVVCLRCDGTGCSTLSFHPFKKRRGRKGVKTVYRSRGTFITTGIGPAPNEGITYAEFKKGMLP